MGANNEFQVHTQTSKVCIGRTIIKEKLPLIVVLRILNCSQLCQEDTILHLYPAINHICSLCADMKIAGFLWNYINKCGLKCLKSGFLSYKAFLYELHYGTSPKPNNFENPLGLGDWCGCSVDTITSTSFNMSLEACVCYLQSYPVFTFYITQVETIQV